MARQIDKYRAIFDGATFIRDGKTVTQKDYMAFDGGGIKRIVKALEKEIRSRKKAVTILDFGSGHGIHWHSQVLTKSDRKVSLVESIGPKLAGFYRYDPAHPLYDEKPTGKYDIILCTDVLEHVPEALVPSVLQEIRTYVKDDGIIYLSIALEPSSNFFSDGENMHCTLMDTKRWERFIAREMKGVKMSITYTGKRTW